MFLENLDADRPAAPGPFQMKRSLSGDFVFLSQDSSMAFAAEACIDVLRSANRLLGQDSYRWTRLHGANALAGGFTCTPDQTLVLVGGTETAWRPDDAHLGNNSSSVARR